MGELKTIADGQMQKYRGRGVARDTVDLFFNIGEEQHPKLDPNVLNDGTPKGAMQELLYRQFYGSDAPATPFENSVAGLISRLWNGSFDPAVNASLYQLEIESMGWYDATGRYLDRSSLEAAHWLGNNAPGFDPTRCFPATTPIATSLTTTTPISNLRIGDVVLAFDPCTELGRGGLVARRVTKLYRNTTTEWVRLSWVEDGEACDVVMTPGHHVLDQYGAFPTIEAMLRDGVATVVLASGALAEVRAERVVYSQATAHLFEQATTLHAAHAISMRGSTALAPQAINAWATYNFEVEDLHTYIAAGIRVHNESGFMGKVGNGLDDAFDKLFGFQNDSFGDNLTNLATSPFHIAGNLLEGAKDAAGMLAVGGALAASSLALGAVAALAHLAQGNIPGALGSLAQGMGGAVGYMSIGMGGALAQAAQGVGGAVDAIVNGLADAFRGLGALANGNDLHGNGFGNGLNAVGNAIDGIGNVIGGTIAGIGTALGNGVAGLGAAVGGVISSIGGAVSGAFGGGSSSDDGGGLYGDNNVDYGNNGGGLYGDDDDGSSGFYPIVLDLDGNGLEITELSQSNVFMDAAGTGLRHRTAWAAAGDGVLFFDPDNRNAITEKRQYVFTEWDPTAKGDLEAVRNVWDTNGDGKLTALDTDFAKFKLLVTQANGSQIVQTLTQAGITEINLKADQTDVQYADGSAITGQTTFTRSNATLGSVANMMLATEATGHAVTTAVSTDVNGNRVVINTAYGLDGSIAHITKSVTSTNGRAFAAVDEKADVKKSRMEPIRAKPANENMCKLQFAA